MNQITATEAFQIIRDFGHTYAMAADTLNFSINNHTLTDCYTDGKALLIVTSMRNEHFVNVLPRTERIDTDNLLSFLKTVPSPVNIIIDTQMLASDCAAALDSVMTEQYAYERTIEDFLHTATESCDSATAPMDSTAAGRVKLLTPNDRDAFVTCSTEQLPHRPPLSLLFDLFVGKGQGYILAAYDQEKIVGYLSFISVSPTLYDIDFVYVAPAYQNRGYGKLLAHAYVKLARENGRDAYWSNAKTEASKSTATAGGFALIRKAHKYVSQA